MPISGPSQRPDENLETPHVDEPPGVLRGLTCRRTTGFLLNDDAKICSRKTQQCLGEEQDRADRCAMPIETFVVHLGLDTCAGQGRQSPCLFAFVQDARHPADARAMRRVMTIASSYTCIIVVRPCRRMVTMIAQRRSICRNAIERIEIDQTFRLRKRIDHTTQLRSDRDIRFILSDRAHSHDAKWMLGRGCMM